MKRITRIRGQETVGSYSYRARLMGVIFVIATIIIIAVTFATFFMSYHTALAQADSPGSINDETASPISAELTTNDKNSGVGEAAATATDMIGSNRKTSDIINNNVITSIIENAQTPGGLSINGTLNQLGAFNYATSSITGNAFMQKIALSGKIASSQFNLQSGNVVATLFGNWSLHAESFNNANLTADFTMRGPGER